MSSLTGTVTFDVKGTSYTVRTDMNALCLYEDLSGKRAGDILLEMEGGTLPAFRDLRALMCAALRASHPDMTIEQAGDLMYDGMAALREALAAAMPTQDDVADMGKPKPARRKAG